MTDQNNEGWPAVLRLNDHYMEEIVGWMQADDKVSGGMTYTRADRAAPEGQVRAKIEGLIEDAIANAEVDYPAGREAGHSITWDSDKLLDDILATITPPPAAPTDNTALVEALRDARIQLAYVNEKQPRGTTTAVIARLDAALASREAQPAAQEPVAWQRNHPDHGWQECHVDDLAHYRRMGQPTRPLYAAPPPACQQEAVTVAEAAAVLLKARDALEDKIEKQDGGTYWMTPEETNLRLLYPTALRALRALKGGSDNG